MNAGHVDDSCIAYNRENMIWKWCLIIWKQVSGKLAGLNYSAWQINAINNTNKINNRLIDLCNLRSGLKQINGTLSLVH